MPAGVATSERFDAALARLAAISSPAARCYIADQRDRCADDALRLAALRPGARILNIGGWPYLFETIAGELNLDVDTLDIAPERAAPVVAQLAGSVRRIDFEDAESRAQVDLSAYDVICMAEIFEHLRIDLPAMFRHLAAHLRPDAIIYLTTPNFFYAPSLVKGLAQGRSGPSLVDEWRKIADGGHMGHVREYSRRELAEFFAFTGFEVVSFGVRNSRPLTLRGGRWWELPVRWLTRTLAATCDRFGQDLVFTLAPAPPGQSG